MTIDPILQQTAQSLKQQIRDQFAGLTDYQMTQKARQENIDPGMLARATGRSVQDIYALMSNVPQSQWTPYELNTVRDFAATNPSAEEIYRNAQAASVSPEQLASAWAEATGSDLAAVREEISKYLGGTGQTLSGGYTPQIEQRNWNQTQLPSYNTYLDNLMQSMNPQGGMMGGNMGFNMPALATSSYVRPTLSNLDAVRQKATDDYTAKKQAEQAEQEKQIEQWLKEAGESGGLPSDSFWGLQEGETPTMRDNRIALWGVQNPTLAKYVNQIQSLVKGPTIGNTYTSSYGGSYDTSGISAEEAAGLAAAQESFGYGSDKDYFGD